MIDYPYEVIRSDRKTVYIEIAPGGVVRVRAPRRFPEREVRKVLEQHESWIRQHLVMAAEREAAHPKPTEAERKALIQKARDILPGKVAHYAAIMGVIPAGITITGAEKRFGSCSGKNRLCFSWRLMSYPEEAIDYVVVHELAHIRHHDHSPAFYAFVESVLPDHKKRRAMLKK